MDLRRNTGLALAALLLAGAFAPASAVPITEYAHLDFGADHALARDRIGGAPAAPAAHAEVAFELAPKPIDLARASLAISFRRWDEGLPGMAGPAIRPETAGR